MKYDISRLYVSNGKPVLFAGTTESVLTFHNNIFEMLVTGICRSLHSIKQLWTVFYVIVFIITFSKPDFQSKPNYRQTRSYDDSCVSAVIQHS